jgi:hypothetical protein
LKTRRRRFLSTLATLGGTWLLVQLPAAAQQGQSGKPGAPPKAAPHLPSGRVDFSGVWRPGDIFLIEDISLGLKPFTITASHRLLPDDDLMEYICQENNRDVHHLVGPAGRP